MTQYDITINGETKWTGQRTKAQAYDKACEIKLAFPERAVALRWGVHRCWIRLAAAKANAARIARHEQTDDWKLGYNIGLNGGTLGTVGNQLEAGQPRVDYKTGWEVGHAEYQEEMSDICPGQPVEPSCRRPGTGC